jgi:hypothetical protein
VRKSSKEINTAFKSPYAQPLGHTYIMKSFGKYYIGIILRPQRTFNELVSDEHRLRFGIFALSINAFLYTLVYIFLTIGEGAPSSS